MSADSQMRRLVVVADDSLIVEAIAIGLRKSGELKLLGHVDARSGRVQAIVAPGPDVVLLDDMEHADRAIKVVRQIRAQDDDVAVIVLTLSMDPQWLESIFYAGAAAAISKATHPAALATLVRETVNGHVVHFYDSLARCGRAAPIAAVSERFSLTTRELEVLGFVAAGSTNGEIAQKLWVTEQTVKFHLSNVYRKLGVTNRTEASHYAYVNGLAAAGQSASTY